MAFRTTSQMLKCNVLSSRAFHTSPRSFVKVGDKIPSLELMEDSPGNKVDIAKELGSGKALIIGVPAAFSKYLLFCIYLCAFEFGQWFLAECLL